MDSQDCQRQSELANLIQFAFAQRKFKKVIQLIDNYKQLFKQQKKLWLLRATANSQLGKPEQCLVDLQNCIRLGAQTKQIFSLKIRSHIELNQIKQAQKSMANLISENQQIKRIIQLNKAIQLVKDQFKSHKLSEEQDKILQKLNIWLREARATYPKLKIVNLVPGYRGAIAIQHIKKHEQIVYIPKSELITLQMAKNSKLISPLIQKKVKFQSPKHTYLSLFLLELKNTNNTKFKPYIDFLPQDHSCFPINFSKKELELLEGSPFLAMIYQKVIDLKKDYEMVIKSEPNLQKYSFKQFCWARMMIGSRIFGLNISGIKTEVLVPFADMLNHRQPKQTIWNYEQSVNGFIIESLQQIQVGQQVFDSYGRKCNSRFLLNYGFVLQQNPDNQIDMHIGQGPPSQNQKANDEIKLDGPVRIDQESNFEFEQQQILLADGVPQVHLCSGVGDSKHVEEDIKYRCHKLAVRYDKDSSHFLKKLDPNLNLSKYPNPIAQDRKLLQRQFDLSQNQINIITLRLGQKHILSQYQRISSQVTQILKSDSIVQALQKKVTQIYARYLFRILCLTPGLNKKNIQKKLGHYFVVQNQQSNLQETQQIPQT